MADRANPWGKSLIEMNVAQLDWILEMYSLENPSDFVFKRAVTDGSDHPASMAAWVDVLRGKALTEYMAGRWAPKATAAWQRDPRNLANKPKRGLRPGVTRRGKPVKGQADG